MSNIIVNGTITTVGPLSIAMPETEKYGGFPVMARGVDAEGNPNETGYLPATTIRGFLRRSVVVDSMKKAAADGGTTLSREPMTSLSDRMPRARHRQATLIA